MYILRFEKEGYEPVEVKLIKTTDGWIWGNLVFGGLVGLVIDFSTGAAYKLAPKEVNVTLKSLGHSKNMEPNSSEDCLVVIDAESRSSN